jgi:hypothetical protein
MVQGDKLLNKNLEHIGEALAETPGAYTVRAEAALEVGANLTLIKNVEERQQSVN